MGSCGKLSHIKISWAYSSQNQLVICLVLDFDILQQRNHLFGLLLITENLQCSDQCAQHLMCFNVLSSHNGVMRLVYYHPHFKDDETEAKKRFNNKMSSAGKWQSQDLNPDLCPSPL